MELLVAIVGALAVIGAAGITALAPVFMRRTRGAVAAEGETTRAVTLDALDVVSRTMTDQVSALGARLDSRVDDVRDDLDEVRESIARVREWQAGHDAEHLLIPRPGGDA
ncbi:hypothetical protein [Streptomyces sp. DH12]|uniref:hypothetical protein n=1 Tax=Streptomyces sp. DH12 TaxID=2857010 RepID=UPI001E4069E7|nr:hypothetical protein [Streptomyces sp. DH12]